MMALLATARGAAAAVLRRDYLVDAGVTEDQANDIKMKADVAAAAVILDALAATGIPVVAEAERAGQSGAAAVGLGQVWYGDPLDGTLDFTRGFAMAAVSVALWSDDERLLGVVHDVFHGTVYAGVVGSGAWCNETPCACPRWHAKTRLSSPPDFRPGAATIYGILARLRAVGADLQEGPDTRVRGTDAGPRRGGALRRLQGGGYLPLGRGRRPGVGAGGREDHADGPGQ
jgi:fructose-1,6-bisphosphatase/inositol monophosphatase family enzyme